MERSLYASGRRGQLSGQKNTVLRNFTCLLMLPYILIFLGVLPGREIYPTIFSIAVFAVFLLWCLAAFDIKIRRKAGAAFLLVALWAALLLMLNFGSLRARSDVVYDANTLVGLGMLFLIFAARHLLFTREMLESALKAIVGFGLLSSVVNIVQNYDGVFSLAAVTQVYSVKFTGLFLGRNQFGWYLYLCLICCMLLKHLFGARVHPAVFFLLAVNLFFTFSRAAMLSAAVFFGLYWLDIRRPKKVLLLLVLLAAFLLLYFTTDLRGMIDRFLIRSNFGDSGRTDRWGALLDTLRQREYGLWGVSPALFKELLLLNGIEQIDNAYLEILASYGFPGCLLYAGVFVSVFVRLKRAEVGRENKRLLTAAVLSFLVLGCFESLLLFEVGLNQWTATLVIVVLPRFCSAHTFDAERGRRIQRELL